MKDRMKRAEQLCSRLQASRKADTFDEWSEYRSSVTQYVLSNCNSNGHLAIMGAGYCNDIDLKRLEAHFSEITLMDLNEAAMRCALNRYHLEGNDKIHLKVVDFVGLTPEDYRNYAAVVLQELEENAAANDSEYLSILNELGSIYCKISGYNVFLGQDLYDCSLIVGVHSQLNDMTDWIWSSCRADAGKRIDYIQDRIGMRISEETAAIVEKFNSAVYQATKKTLITGYEVDLNGMAQPIQGVIQAEHDFRIKELQRKLQLKDVQTIQWPYDSKNNILFTMKMQTFKLRK